MVVLLDFATNWKQKSVHRPLNGKNLMISSSSSIERKCKVISPSNNFGSSLDMRAFKLNKRSPYDVKADDGTQIGSFGTRVATETCGQVNPAKFRNTIWEY